jgi:glycine betaine transporter
MSEKPARRDTDYFVALVGCAAIAVLGLAYPAGLAEGATGFVDAVLRRFDVAYMLTVASFVLACLWLALGRHGKLRLGREGERPEFSTGAWWAMLFAAGMGTGLMFWGVAEPIRHYADPPVGAAQTPIAARQAIAIAEFHWGLHAWAIYAIAALALAYFHFRRDRDYLPGAPVRAAFSGRWVEPVARASDFVGVLAVAFGVAGAIGMGVLQIRSGLSVVTGLDFTGASASLGIVAALAVAYTASAASGIARGIKWLSSLNVALAVGLLASVLMLGPTSALLGGFARSIADYGALLVPLGVVLEPWRGLDAWLHEWTLAYLIWWIAWAPFVGVFVARISRGRTIREFIAGVVLAPTAFSMVWFATFGGTAIELERVQGGVAELVEQDIASALFAVLAQLGAPALLSVLAIALTFVFLVTSVDSAAYVLGMITSAGVHDPPWSRKLAWSFVLALLAAALVLGGHVGVVKAVAILGAIPFTVVLVLQAAALVRALWQDRGA